MAGDHRLYSYHRTRDRAEIRFTVWTADGRLRHPLFLGLRPVKDALHVHRETSLGSS